jgi:hypothetical protein
MQSRTGETTSRGEATSSQDVNSTNKDLRESSGLAPTSKLKSEINPSVTTNPVALSTLGSK